MFRMNRYAITPMMVLTLAVVIVLTGAGSASAEVSVPTLVEELDSTADSLTGTLGDGVTGLGEQADEILPPVGPIDLGPTISDTTSTLGDDISSLGDEGLIGVLNPPEVLDPGSPTDTGTPGGQAPTAGTQDTGSAPGDAGGPGTETGPVAVAGVSVGPDTLGQASQNWGIAQAFSNSLQNGPQLRLDPAQSSLENFDPVSAGLAALPLLGLLIGLLAIISYLKSARGIIRNK